MKQAVKKVLSVILALTILVVPAGMLKADAGETLVWPVPGHTAETGSLYQRFSAEHQAIDISDGSIAGATVVCAMGGTVERIYLCGDNHKNYGDCSGFGTGLVIKGDDGRHYQYAHMEPGSIPSNVYYGAYVPAGAQVGRVGNTGWSYGYHLHFQIGTTGIYDGCVDPMLETYGSQDPAPADIGEDFYATFLNKASWKPISVKRGTGVTIETEDGTSTQKWRFTRQSDGAYVIRSCSTGKVLEMTDGIRENCVQVTAKNDFSGENYQQWYVIPYGSDNSWIIQNKHYYDEGWVLDLYGNDSSDGNIVEIYKRNNSAAQIWSIYSADDVQLKPTTLTATVNSSDVTFTWDEVFGESSYDVKIWKGEVWDGDPYIIKWNAKSGCIVNLPAGTYSAYVDACDYFQCFMSNVVTFTIDKAEEPTTQPTTTQPVPSTTLPATTVPSTSPSYDENPTVPFTGTTTEDNAVYGTYGIFEYKIDNGEATIIKCDPEVRGKILIPDSIEGYPVTELGYESFYPCGYITELIIPDTVKKIGAYAFCCDFANITIPASVTEIGYRAFSECRGLESITVDENNRRYSSDEFGVLFDKNKTTLIQYPSKCSETNYKIPESVLKIEGFAFVWTDVEYVTVPKSVKEIGLDSFGCCEKLREINVDSANAEYSSDEFGILFNKDKTKLLSFPAGNSTKNYTVPEGVEEIEMCAFGDAVNLESVVIPEGVEEIGYCTFADCHKLKSVNLPESLRVVGDQAFIFCESLENIYIPYGVAKIEWLAFRGCTNLEYVHIPETVGYIGETILLETDGAYICSYTEDCYAKMYADDNGYEFRVCDNHGFAIPEFTVPQTTTPTTTQRVETTVTPSTTKPVTEPTTAKPIVPSTTKPVTTKPETVEEKIIKKPSTSTVKYGETLILHADFTNIPEGTKIEWCVEGDGVSIVPSEDGKTCSVTSNATGDVTIVAKYTDSNGVEHISEQSIESKAGIWQKIVYFVKTIFGISMLIPNAFKSVF